MALLSEATRDYYLRHLPGAKVEENTLVAPCPFCEGHGRDNAGKLVVYLNKDGYFNGYFRCLSRCVSGGFPLWFAYLSGISPEEVPGYDPDHEPYLSNADYPPTTINTDISQYVDRLTPGILERFKISGVSGLVLKQLKIGFNGRYIVFPYFKEDGNCYSARCVYPGNPEDRFWYGDENFFELNSPLFNVEEVQRCANGALFICEGEENLIAIKQLGFPGVAVHSLKCFDKLDPQQFSQIKTIFIAMTNSPESMAAGRRLAERIGFKVRLFPWPPDAPKNYSLWQLAIDKGKDFQTEIISRLNLSRAFSPFSSPTKEYNHFNYRMKMESSDQFKALKSGFPKLDYHLDGIHGINVLGGPPKTGKSALVIQAASDMALRKVPVLYYDFENGRQKIYQRILSRLSRLSDSQLRKGGFDTEQEKRYTEATALLKKMLYYLRVVNDRHVTPEIMRRHIDFIQHETRSPFTIVVIDSLHKLPFKDFSERRTGIDAWLRQMESIRDEMQVSFLVISELTRGDKGSYNETPHMGMFKGSGDIEYSADNAMIVSPVWNGADGERNANDLSNNLWLVASREHGPGPIARYRVDYPYWGFIEE